MLKIFLLSIFISVLLLSHSTTASLSPKSSSSNELDEVPAKSSKINNRIMIDDHLICFKCETGRYPEAVKEMVIFIPENENCKALFSGKKFISKQPGFNEFRIITETSNSGVMFIMSKEGLGVKDVWGAKAFYNITIDKKNLMCGM